MADAVAEPREEDQTPGNGELPNQSKTLTDQLRDLGGANGDDKGEQRELASPDDDFHVVHNIPWRHGFESVVFTVRSIRNLLPDRDWPPPVALRRADAPIRIAPVEGKGMGLFATRTLPPGVPVLVERPSLVMPHQFSTEFEVGPTTATHDPRTAPINPCKMVFERAGPSQRAALLALYNCKPPEMCEREEGIIRTNALGIELRVPEGWGAISTHAAVFLDASRANHSCSPNLGCTWDVDSFTMTLFTQREVKEDEELTIPYVNHYMSFAQRQEELKRMYLFDCACKACAKEGDARAKSDKRRAEMKNLGRTLDVAALLERWNTLRSTGWDRAMAEREVFKPFKTTYNMFVKEGVHGGVWQAQCADALMRFYKAMGEGKAAALWAKRAAQAYMVWYWSEEDKDRRFELLEMVRDRKAVADRAAKQSMSA